MRTLAHGYTNDTRTDGTLVVKRYSGPGARMRHERELSALTLLQGALPVPRLVGHYAQTLQMNFVEGVQGQELLDAGHARAVLRSCGRMLRRIQSVDATVIFPTAAAGEVVVHGDFGPNNALFDPATFAVTAVVDWEWAHPGRAIEDLAWCEWIVRMHHPDQVEALDTLFDAYGDQPPWPARHAEMTARCEGIRDLLQSLGGTVAVGRWDEKLAITTRWAAL